MAKISVSLPDTLKEQLDGHVAEHGGSVSQTVQAALEVYLNSPSPSPEPTPPDGHLALLEKLVTEMRQELKTALHELMRTQHSVEAQRQCLIVLQPLADMASIQIPVPPPLIS